MEADTSIAQTLDAAGDKIRYDEACKKLLSEKIILAWIMQTCLEEYSKLDVWEIAAQYIEGVPQVGRPRAVTDSPMIQGAGMEDVTVTGQRINYDIRFSAIAPGEGETVGLLINVEAQNNYYPGYPLVKRALYYCSRMISGQYGTVFTHSHYEKLQKVYSIWICMDPPKERKKTITEYFVQERNLYGYFTEERDRYDLLSVIIICLGEPSKQYNPNAGQKEQLIRLLEVLFSVCFNATEKKQILEKEYNIPMTESLERLVDDMCNLSDGVEAKGIEKGIEQGIEKGIEKGIEQGMLLSILNLMETMKFSVDQAMDALKIPADKQAGYAVQIQKR